MRQIIINRQVVSAELIELLKENNIRFRETDVDTRPCQLCGKDFILRGLGTKNERKFCSVECATRFRAKIAYEFNKNNPEFKKIRSEYFKEIGFNLFDTMIYFKNGGLNSGANNSYIQKFEYMFILTKGKIKNANILEDRPNIYTKVRMKKKRDLKDGEYRIQEIITKEQGKRYNIWSVNTGIPHSTKDKVAYQHPAIFPEQLAEDHIKSWSNEGDLVLDCMCGSGTTCKMALLNNRKFIGIEISPEYCDISRERLKPYLQQDKLFAKVEQGEQK